MERQVASSLPMLGSMWYPSVCLLLFVIPSMLSAQREAVGILVEAEDYAAKGSEALDFAYEVPEFGASSGVALARVFHKGHLVYELRVPRAGTWSIWVRYAATRGMRMGFLLDAELDAKPDTAKVVVDTGRYLRGRLAATPGLTGRGAYRFGLLVRRKFTAGKHRLVLASGGYRLDCIYLRPGSKDTPPEAAEWRAAGRRTYSPKKLKLLARPLRMVRPAWMDELRGYRLPTWFGGQRGQAHTRLSLRWMDKPIFSEAGGAFAAMGAKVFARHIKSGDEGAWWPSAVGAVSPRTKGRDLAQEIIDEAHKSGEKIIAYSRHMEDEAAAAAHPDWVCVDARGKPLSSRRGKYLCFNSPYADFVQTRLLELVERGADGFYFDEAHQPKQGCWCRYCKKRFRKETGLELPRGYRPFDPLWNKLRDFTNATIERTFLRWRKAIHDKRADCVLLISANSLPGLEAPTLSTRLLRLADSVKTEWGLADRRGSNRIFEFAPELPRPERGLRLAQGWDLARDAADGRPAHVWTHGFEKEQHILLAAAAVLGHGCIPNLDVQEKDLPDARFEKAFALAARVSPTLVGKRPWKDTLLHYPQAARDQLLTDPLERWQQVLGPFQQAYAALARQRRPFALLTDSQFVEGIPEECRCLVLPSPSRLGPAMARAVAAFRKRGGLVLGYDQAKKSWPNDLLDAKVFARELPPTQPQVLGGPAKMQVQFFVDAERKQLSVALIQDFSGLQDGFDGKGKARRPKPQRLAKAIEGVTLRWRADAWTAGTTLRDVAFDEPLTITKQGAWRKVRVKAFDTLRLLSFTRR